MKLIEMSLSAGLLIVLIVLVRAIAIDKLPKTAFLLLWGVALARLLIPYSIPVEGLPLMLGPTQTTSYVNIYNEAGEIVGGSAAMDMPRIPGLNDLAARIAQRMDLGSHQGAVAAVWALGAAALAAYYLTILRKSRRALGEALPLKRLSVRVRGQRKARVYVSDRVSTPLTYGLFRPRIVLPRDSRFQSKQQLRCVLEHEAVHIRRLDILWKGLLLCALCLHWFNPLVWVMYLLACRDIELSCDERVLRRLGGDGRKAYAMTLIHCEEQRGAPVPLASAFAKNAVEERIVSIMKYKKRTRFGTTTAAVLLALSLSAFAISDTDNLPFTIQAQPLERAPLALQPSAFAEDSPQIAVSYKTPDATEFASASATLVSLSTVEAKADIARSIAIDSYNILPAEEVESADAQPLVLARLADVSEESAQLIAVAIPTEETVTYTLIDTGEIVPVAVE